VALPGSELGLGDHGLGLLLGYRDDAGRLLATLGNCEIGGALSQQQGTPERVVRPTRLIGRLLGPLGSLDGLAQAILEYLDPRCYPLEKLVDVLGVVPPHLLTEFDFT
jgi:hypothetical protein